MSSTTLNVVTSVDEPENWRLGGGTQRVCTAGAACPSCCSPTASEWAVLHSRVVNSTTVRRLTLAL